VNVTETTDYIELYGPSSQTASSHFVFNYFPEGETCFTMLLSGVSRIRLHGVVLG